MPVFAGARSQRGHDLGNIFGKLLRNVVVPIVTSAIKSGIDVAGYMARGKTFGESARKHVPVPTGIKSRRRYRLAERFRKTGTQTSSSLRRHI